MTAARPALSACGRSRARAAWSANHRRSSRSSCCWYDATLEQRDEDAGEAMCARNGIISALRSPAGSSTTAVRRPPRICSAMASSVPGIWSCADPSIARIDGGPTSGTSRTAAASARETTDAWRSASARRRGRRGVARVDQRSRGSNRCRRRSLRPKARVLSRRTGRAGQGRTRVSSGSGRATACLLGEVEVAEDGAPDPDRDTEEGDHRRMVRREAVRRRVSAEVVETQRSGWSMRTQDPSRGDHRRAAGMRPMPVVMKSRAAAR